MIELYTGTPGSGKSLHCADVIYNRIMRGKTVIANFDINMSVFPKARRLGTYICKDNWDLTPQWLMQYAVDQAKRSKNGHIKEGQFLLIIDECQIMFNSRDWQAKNRMEWCVFFTQHRKYGFNIILITQYDRMIDRQIRALVEYHVIHRKINNCGLFGTIVGLLCGGKLFVAVSKWYSEKMSLGSQWFRFKRKYARLYDSYRIFSVSAEGDTPVSAGGCPAAGAGNSG